MFNKANTQVTIFALIFSIAAVGLSTFSLSKAGDKGAIDDQELMAKVEQGIEGYIAKKRALQNGEEEKPEEKPVEVSIDDDAVKGDKNAPVTIVEFSDFQCPFCARFFRDTLPQITADYIDKGKANFVYRDFPLDFHPNAKPAAIAAECAREQGGDKVYFKYHDKLYENSANLSSENYKKWAEELGLKTDAFSTCLTQEKYAAEVDKDMQDGKNYGVTGTPAFFINGRLITGAQPFAVFKTMIEEELKK